MKKTILITIIITLLFTPVGIELYFYFRYDGNLIIHMCNDSDIENVNIELYLDGKKLTNENFSNKTFHEYKKYSFNIPFGKHTLTVKNENIIKEYKFNSFLVKWIVIDFGNEFISGKNKYIFTIISDILPILIT